MKHWFSLKKYAAFALLLTAVLALPNAWASGVAVETVAVQAEGGAIAYPRLAGMPNVFLQDKINAAIEAEADISAYTALSKQKGGTGVTLSYESWLLAQDGVPAVLSLVIQAEGKMLSGRVGHRFLPMMFDLKTGEKIDGRTLFSRPEEAQAFLDGWVENDSGLGEYTYLDLSAALPVPLDRAVLTDSGIRLCYPENSFIMLSGRSGAFDFHFDELESVLAHGEGSLIASLDAWRRYQPDHETAQRLEADVQRGVLPTLPDVMGKDIQALVDAYKEMTDPEAHLDGERYDLEAPVFRGVSLVVGEGQGSVTGILTRRANLYGLATGSADRKSCLALLGGDYTELPMDGQAAAQYGMPQGVALVRQAGAYRLMLGFDGGDILRAVYLSKQD